MSGPPGGAGRSTQGGRMDSVRWVADSTSGGTERYFGPIHSSRTATKVKARAVFGGQSASRTPGEPGRYPRDSTTGRIAMSVVTKGRRVCWRDSPRDDLMAAGQGGLLHGE